MKSYDEQVEKFGSPASYFYRGCLWKEQRNFPNAIADFEEAIKLYPEYDRAYIELGESYLANGDFTKAISILNDSMERNFGYLNIALLLRARTNLAAGNSEEAMRDFDQTIAVTTDEVTKYPSYSWGYVYRGHAHAAQGNIVEAIADHKKALDLEPQHAEANTMRDYILTYS